VLASWIPPSSDPLELELDDELLEALELAEVLLDELVLDDVVDEEVEAPPVAVPPVPEPPPEPPVPASVTLEPMQAGFVLPVGGQQA
jgi:hypothetical protein